LIGWNNISNLVKQILHGDLVDQNLQRDGIQIDVLPCSSADTTHWLACKKKA
jgi:hypothetical protein